ncbi:3-beta hydroxysteroid dehydrogenase [Caulobacter sp. CCUG 60055]|uniref:NAD(P)-dependent oxidoreductase n=1 Tax=Caulobacter sp. CCUG 60055 TaxID=2100090 RepID=UPI001FA6F4D1|nr:NAD(P)-dependent oxidoreductase [Caulobacter sp. CCUG 60055]MBQ1541732.1 NAD(P)-dependent oxidoreductase [Caulobacteraceae bacterium]MCI3181885.1 3-beta hydroxysteroid dehydrogenase [Caulobacter sp. CCUG 60055]
MYVAVIGATGNVGSRIVEELLRRGHRVRAVVRRDGALAARPDLDVVRADAGDRAALARALEGVDAAVSAVKFLQSDPAVLIGAVKDAGVPRYLVVGGAGSLEVAPGQRLVDQPFFHAEWKPEALGGAAFLEALRAEPDLDWTFLSPSALFVPGERTGVFRLGDDQLLTAADGKSSISFEDYAVALVDELETPQRRRRRFTVGY